MRASEIQSKHLQRLLEAGAFVDAIDKLGRCALHYAAKTGSDDSINLLVAYGADPNIRDVKSGETPIHVACREGKDSTVRFLAQSCGVSWYGINSQKRVGKYTPLHEACRWGHAGSARVLLGLAEEEEMQSYSQSSSQNQSHHLLKQHDSFQNDDQYSNNSNTDTQHKCLSRLLIEVVNDNHCGVSPIAIASQYGHLQVLWVLIQSGAVRQPCSQWFPKLDPKLHKHLRSWVDAVLDDPRLTLTTTPNSSSNSILHDLRHRLEPGIPVNEDDIIDDGAADY
mmetsp:Transcript_45724/g.58719  ORF Transcript_45724/g.58719 Transcript_45724/m.58719 type:complete len:281 (+) Transcript_45724:335-1177(+)